MLHMHMQPNKTNPFYRNTKTLIFIRVTFEDVAHSQNAILAQASSLFNKITIGTWTQYKSIFFNTLYNINSTSTQ